MEQVPGAMQRGSKKCAPSYSYNRNYLYAFMRSYSVHPSVRRSICT